MIGDRLRWELGLTMCTKSHNCHPEQGSFQSAFSQIKGDIPEASGESGRFLLQDMWLDCLCRQVLRRWCQKAFCGMRQTRTTSGAESLRLPQMVGRKQNKHLSFLEFDQFYRIYLSGPDRSPHFGAPSLQSKWLIWLSPFPVEPLHAIAVTFWIVGGLLFSMRAASALKESFIVV